MESIRKRRKGVVEQPDDCPREQVNGCPQFKINECEEHCKSKLDTITVRVPSSKTEKLQFLIDTGAVISIVKGKSLKPGTNYEPTKGINMKGMSNALITNEGTVTLKLLTSSHETTLISYHGR